jgi:hypothetical protein
VDNDRTLDSPESEEQTPNGNVFRWVGAAVWKGVLPVIGMLAAILTILATFAGEATETPWWVFAVGYWFFAFVLVGYLIWQIAMRYSAEDRNNRTALQLSLQQDVTTNLWKAIDHMHSIVHELRNHMVESADCDSWNNEMKGTMLNLAVEKVLKNLVGTLSAITGTRCAAAVYLLRSGKDEYGRRMFSTFCRDPDSLSSGRALPKDGVDKFSMMEQNDFHHILTNKNKHLFFLSDNVDTHQDFSIIREDFRGKYKSLYVAAIAHSAPRAPTADGKPLRDIRGFLQLDSVCERAFEREQMRGIAGCVADALYWPIRLHEEYGITVAEETHDRTTVSA